MAKITDRWGLSRLGPGDSIADDGFKFADADRRRIDGLLRYAVEQHHHTGLAGTDYTPSSGPTLMLQTSGGSIPSGLRYYYRHTIVDGDGNESGPSPVQSIDMPLTIVAPPAPSPTAVSGSGDLGPGSYSYVCSAYKTASNLETKALNSAPIKVTGTNPHNSVSLTLPDLPVGATGLNVYRKSPSGTHYLYITAIDTPTSGEVWLDDGSVDGDCDRSLPPINRTANENMVTVTLPGATPSIPAGWSWRIYRTTSPSDWGRSFLEEIGAQGATPFTPTTYPDTGSATQIGAPPARAQVIHAPPKIILTDSAEVEGTLPPGLLVVPQVLTFVTPGPVVEDSVIFEWVNDYELADIQFVRPYLPYGAAPASQPVLVDVQVFRADYATPIWESIFYPDIPYPSIAVGSEWSRRLAPARRHVAGGNLVRGVVLQDGGGATPTDYDLAVNVVLYVKEGSETESYVWEGIP